MGSISARKCAQIADHVRSVLAIEALVAVQGLDFRAPLRPGRGVHAAHARLRERIPPLSEDRPLYLDIEAARELVRDGVLLRAAEAAVGPIA